MRLGTLTQGLPIRHRGGGDPEIASIVEDSREVRPGALFVARPGTKVDGRAFVADAVARGAVAVLTNGPIDAGGAEVLEAEAVASVGAILAERLVGEPSRALSLIGVTGTNGKTTTAWLLRQILDRADVPCGFVGTIGVDDGDGLRPLDWTTPPAHRLSRTLAGFLARGRRAAAMEVSSHALSQARVAGLTFAGAIYTNLSGDHLDYHPTMEDYAAAKALLFERLASDAWAVVNADDPFAPRMTRDCRARVVRCRVDAGSDADAEAEFAAGIVSSAIDGTRVGIRTPRGRHELLLPLVGRHNVANALEAIAAASCLGVSVESSLATLETAAAPPGRLEAAHASGDEVSVFVDYAHTDAALENVLSALRPLVTPPSRLAVVVGCGGDRDRTKRPRMALAACRFADRVYLTSDNPRTEDPASILAEMEVGVPADSVASVRTIVDRREAILAAVADARPGDTVLIAGKGHEDYQIHGTTKRPFDDRLVAREALACRTGSGGARAVAT